MLKFPPLLLILAWRYVAATNDLFKHANGDILGKNPVFIDPNSDLKLAARRLLWAKQSNAGQVRIAKFLCPNDLIVNIA